MAIEAVEWIELGDDERRAEIRDRDTGERIARLIAFRGLGLVRFVTDVPLLRDGLTFHYEEALQMRDALTVALGEIDAFRAGREQER